jgi:hypothetical protein
LETIKEDLITLFKDFHENKLPLYSLNFGIIMLQPKLKEVAHITQFRAICLVNVSFKIFTKVVVTRMARIVEKMVSQSQTTFIPRRNIMEGVTMLFKLYMRYIGKR